MVVPILSIHFDAIFIRDSVLPPRFDFWTYTKLLEDDNKIIADCSLIANFAISEPWDSGNASFKLVSYRTPRDCTNCRR